MFICSLCDGETIHQPLAMIIVLMFIICTGEAPYNPFIFNLIIIPIPIGIFRIYISRCPMCSIIKEQIPPHHPRHPILEFFQSYSILALFL